MGLGLCVDGRQVAQWSYSGFNEFRRKLAKEIGIDLDQMEGFGSAEERANISWDAIDDPIKFLLNHSDCDGVLTPKECAQVAPRLAELIENWPEKLKIKTKPEHQKLGYPEELVLDDHDTCNAKGLVKGMYEAAKTNKPLEFY